MFESSLSSFGFRLPRRSYAKAGHSFVIRHSSFVIFQFDSIAAGQFLKQEYRDGRAILYAVLRIDAACTITPTTARPTNRIVDPDCGSTSAL